VDTPWVVESTDEDELVAIQSINNTLGKPDELAEALEVSKALPFSVLKFWKRNRKSESYYIELIHDSYNLAFLSRLLAI
jgi:hypothetical protein